MDLNKALDAVDERLVFEAGRHRYKLDGEYVPGVTTILNSKNKPALEAWKVRVQQEADIETAWQAMQEWANFDSHDEFVSKFREAAGKEYEHQKQAREAADIGSEVHALAEKHMKDILGIPFTILQTPSEQAQAIFERSWLPWEKDAGVVPLAVERRVYHAEHKYAGTVDLLATVEGKLTCLDWKGLALDTSLPTPAGWTTMGEVSEGDQLFDSSGNPCTVIGKSNVSYKDCYRITFHDRSTVVCDADHVWMILHHKRSGRQADKESLLSPAQIQEILTGSVCSVRNARPLALPVADLGLDPYVLGCWLGDGCRSTGIITKPLDSLWAEIGRRGFSFTEKPYVAGKGSRTVYGLQSLLKDLGVFKNKHIPRAFLRGAVAQRLDLLRGLMDTDGNWNKPRGQAIFTSCNRLLAKAVQELAHSLGQKTNWDERAAKGFGLTVWRYQIAFNPQDLNPFIAKSDRAVLKDCYTAKNRRIVSVEKTITVPTQCLAVDSPDESFLCTESMIPTHNSKGVAQVEKLYVEPALQSVAYREALRSLTGETWGGLVINMPREGSGSVVAHPITGNDSWTLDDAFTVFLACKVLYVFDSKFNRKAKK